MIDEGVSASSSITSPKPPKRRSAFHELDRAEVRAIFEERFTAERMAEDYLAVYRELAGVGMPGVSLGRDFGLQNVA